MEQSGQSEGSEDEYEIFVRRGQRRFRRIVFSLLGLLIVTLFVPLSLAPSVIKESTAVASTVFAGFLLLAVWRALLIKIGDPSDAPDASPEGQKRHLKELLLVAGGCLAAIAVLDVICFAAQLYGMRAFFGFIMLLFVLSVGIVRTLLGRGVNSALPF